MTNSSNRHRRRLHMIQNEQNRSVSSPSDQGGTFPVPDEEFPESALRDSPTQSARTATEASFAAPKPSLPPRSSHDRNYMKYMNYFRHILVVTILTTFGYLYSQHDQTDQSTESSDSAEVAPFSHWENIAQVPALNVATVSQSGTGVPMPISLTEKSGLNLSGIPTDLSNWVESKKTNVVSQLNTSSRQPLGTNNISKLKKRSLSLWDEPGLTQVDAITQKVESIASLTGEVPAPIDIEREQQQQKQSNSPVDNSVESQETVSQLKQGAVPPVSVEFWRQFTLGSGKQSTVCVIDKSVTGDALLLSSIFTSIRREWMSDVSRSRKQRLVLLIANTQQVREPADQSGSVLIIQQRQLELRQKIEVSAPTRIISLSRGDDDRGWIRFSSEQESVAALMFVPGMYRITAPMQTEQYSRSSQQVSIELPAQAQESTTVDLLFTAISGNWTGQTSEDASGYLASRDAYGKTGSSRNQSSQAETQVRRNKGRVEILSAPPVFRQQANSQKKPAHKSFFKLPPAPVHADN